MDEEPTYTAFLGDERVASGTLRELLGQVKPRLDEGTELPLLIFEDQSGKQVDFNLRGTLEEVLEREAPVQKRSGPGRPRLGVVSREVSLLPRHWAWLEGQPNGASAALRRLVDETRKHEANQDRARRLTDAVGHFMSVMAGNRENFEEAYRALYAGDQTRFRGLIKSWPQDVRDHLERLIQDAFRTNE